MLYDPTQLPTRKPGGPPSALALEIEKAARRLGRWHLPAGCAAVAIFVGTGLWMRVGLNDLDGLDPFGHLLYRSNHIYLLFSALLNVALGLHPAPAPPLGRAWARLAGSSLVLVDCALLVVAFFLEPGRGELDRPLTSLAVIGTAVGAGLLLLSRRKETKLRPVGGDGERIRRLVN